MTIRIAAVETENFRWKCLITEKGAANVSPQEFDSEISAIAYGLGKIEREEKFTSIALTIIPYTGPKAE